MSYLPNSIERCAPILGFDPYAFIMDKPSNFIPGNTPPLPPDSFEQQPVETLKKTNPESKPKSGFIKGAKYLAAIVTVAALTIGFRRCTNGIRKLLDLPQKQMPKPLRAAKEFVSDKIYEPVKNIVTDLVKKIIKKP